jgi:hypothetical protein
MGGGNEASAVSESVCGRRINALSNSTQPFDFDGEISWDADALARLIPNDREAARAVPNEVFVQDRFRLGVFLRSTQRMIEETADDEPSDNESDDVDEARNSEGQDIPRYVKKRYPKRTKQHELMTSRLALGRRDTNIARYSSHSWKAIRDGYVQRCYVSLCEGLGFAFRWTSVQLIVFCGHRKRCDQFAAKIRFQSTQDPPPDEHSRVE